MKLSGVPERGPLHFGHWHGAGWDVGVPSEPLLTICIKVLSFAEATSESKSLLTRRYRVDGLFYSDRKTKTLKTLRHVVCNLPAKHSIAKH